MAKSSLTKLLAGYETPVYPREDGGEINTGIKFRDHAFSGSITARKKKLLSYAIVRFFSRITKMISYTSTRGFGALFLSYGLLTLIYEISKVYFNGFVTDAVLPLALGALAIMLAIPLLIIDKPFSIALADFAPTDYIFFEFFSIKRTNRQSAQRGLSPLLMAILGLILATCGMFFDFGAVFFAIASTVAVYLSFISPEFAFFSTIIFLPVFPLLGNGRLMLACMIGAAFLSFLRKVIFGKRVYSAEQYDLVIALLMTVILAVGIFVRGIESFESSLWILVFSLGYPLASNLLTNRRVAELAIGAMVGSSLFPTLYTVCEVIILLVNDGFSAIVNYSATATFLTRGAFAAFLLAVTFAAAYFISVAKHKAVRTRYVVVLVLDVFALLLTRRVDAALALVAGLLAYKIMRRGRRLVPVAALAIFIPLLPLLLPSEIYDVIFAYFGMGYTRAELIELWRASVEMLRDKLLVGVGIGADSFSSVIAEYGQTAENSSALLLEIACEAGVFAFAMFFILLLVRLRHRSVYREYINESHVTHLSCISAATVTMLIAFGMTEYIWADQTICYLFWCIFGIGSATLRIAKREHDDRVMYYGDLTTVDSSVIDVKVR